MENQGFNESGHATGIYNAILRSPLEGKREECVSILTKIEKLETFISKKGNVLIKVIQKIMHKYVTNKIVKLQSQYNMLSYVKETDTFSNIIVDVGKNWMLEATLGASATLVGPYMGLISSVGYTGIPVNTDTMASHATAGHVWTEAGSAPNYPIYSGTRKTCVWSAASSGAKSLSAALSFVCATTGGTVKGCFIVLGTGAVNTIADTNGTLYSAGVFTGGDKVMSVGDTLQVSYTTSI